MKALFLEIHPESIDVGNMKDQPPPLGGGVAMFQIEDRVFPIFRAERRKISLFFPVGHLHAEYIPIEPHRDGHTGHSKRNCGNLLDIHVHLQAPTASRYLHSLAAPTSLRCAWRTLRV